MQLGTGTCSYCLPLSAPFLKNQKNDRIRQKTTKNGKDNSNLLCNWGQVPVRIEICATGDRYLFVLVSFKQHSFFEESKKRQNATKNDKNSKGNSNLIRRNMCNWGQVPVRTVCL